jgi:hypothetical protein
LGLPGSGSSGASAGTGYGLPGSGTGAGIPGLVIPGGAETGLPDPAGGIAQILRNLLIWFLEIVGVVALIGFVVSGTQYILAAGDSDVIETAKKNLTYSVIGVVVVLASFVIIQAIAFALEARSYF